MTELLVAIGVFAWLESMALMFVAGWMLRGSREPKGGRLPNWMIDELEEGMAGNVGAYVANERALNAVTGTLEFLQRELTAQERHLAVTREVFGEKRGRPFDGSDRDKESS